MPSIRASFCAVSIASGPAMGTSSSYRFIFCASSRTFGMKSGVQPWMGCAANAGCDPLGAPVGLRSVTVPDAMRPAASGSRRTIFVSGLAALMTRPTPWNVPPVPYPVTK